MFSPTDRFEVRYHSRTDSYFLFHVKDDNTLGELASKVRFWDEYAAVTFVGDRDGNPDNVDVMNYKKVPAGFKAPKKK